MPSTTSPNMGLTVPTVGQEPGPAWANDINADLTVIDQHNHSTGQGVQITPSGINISSDLTFNSNNATTLKTARFASQPSSLAGAAPNLGCVYVAGNELYYNDENGNVVQITNNGSVNAGAGSITGLPSGTASASFSAGTFVWQSATSTPATMDMGHLIVRNNSASSNGVTVQPPASLPSSYTLTLPSIPSATSYLTIDSSGNFGSQVVGPARSVSSSVGAGGVAISSSSGNFTTTSSTLTAVTNLSISITTTGRPVLLLIQPDGSGADCVIGPAVNGASQYRVSSQVHYFRGASDIAQFFLETGMATNANAQEYLLYSSNSFMFIDTGVAGSAGTYTYSVQTDALSSSGSNVKTYFQYCTLVAYEI